nr:ELAV-like-3 [Pleurobrachia bachei]|eukprot:sb/3466232/
MTNLLDHPDLTPEQRKNLILNYLPPDIDEQYLKDLFSSLGSVEYVRIIRDKMTQRSMGYAFAKYCDTEPADRAVQEFDGLPLGDKVMRVNYARPPSEKIKNTNIYIANFPTNMSEGDITKMCQDYGRIISYKLLLDAHNQSRGIAFCRFDTNEEAVKAIEGLNGKVPAGGSLPLVVKMADKPSDKYKKTETAPAHVYSPARENGSYPQLPQSYLPLLASHPSGAHRTLIFSRDHPLAGQFAAVQNNIPPQLQEIARSAYSPLQGWCLYLCNLSPNMNEHGLYKLVAPFGAISSIKCMEHTDGTCKGIAFINMPQYEEAALAIKALNGATVHGNVIQVEFKKSSMKTRQ